MRAQPLPVFFLVTLAVVLTASLSGGIAVSVLVFHDHVSVAGIVNTCIAELVFSTMVTRGERARRRRTAGTP